jgi:hypothetical protein
MRALYVRVYCNPPTTAIHHTPPPPPLYWFSLLFDDETVPVTCTKTEGITPTPRVLTCVCGLHKRNNAARYLVEVEAEAELR